MGKGRKKRRPFVREKKERCKETQIEEKRKKRVFLKKGKRRRRKKLKN
jgi:hypothetical protein